MSKFVIALACVAVANAGAVELTNSNFDAEVTDSGKNAFIKFQAPWWGHCKSMKPAWDKLGDEYKGSTSVLVGDADCTAETELCGKIGVQGYPTIKYFKDGNTEGESYSGGRDFDSLQKFVQDTLEVKCSVNETSGCTEKEIKFISKMNARGGDDINKQLTRLEGMSASSMKAELKQWMGQRLNILRQLKSEL